MYNYLAVVDSTAVVSAPDSLEASLAALSFADSTALEADSTALEASLAADSATLEASLAADSAALQTSLPADSTALEASLAADSTALEASALGALEPQAVKASIATAATANNLNFNIFNTSLNRHFPMSFNKNRFYTYSSKKSNEIILCI